MPPRWSWLLVLALASCSNDSAGPSAENIEGDASTCADDASCEDINCDEIDCNDNDQCTTDACDPDTGQCLYAAVDCEDGDMCTTNTCDPVEGCASEEVNCDDGSLCTTDSCDPATGCVNEPRVCQSSNTCLIGQCNEANGQCVFGTLTDFTSCTTRDDLAGVCIDGQCRRKCTVDRECFDNRDCTIDRCTGTSTKYCTYPSAPDGSGCFDGTQFCSCFRGGCRCTGE